MPSRADKTPPPPPPQENRELKNANGASEKAVVKLERQVKQKSEEIEFMQAIKRHQVRGWVKRNI